MPVGLQLARRVPGLIRFSPTASSPPRSPGYGEGLQERLRRDALSKHAGHEDSRRGVEHHDLVVEVPGRGSCVLGLKGPRSKGREDPYTVPCRCKPKRPRYVEANPAYGAVGLAFAGTTFSARRTLETGVAARGAEVALKAADRMSGSSRLAVTSTFVPRGRVSGRSNQ